MITEKHLTCRRLRLKDPPLSFVKNQNENNRPPEPARKLNMKSKILDLLLYLYFYLIVLVGVYGTPSPAFVMHIAPE